MQSATEAPSGIPILRFQSAGFTGGGDAASLAAFSRSLAYIDIFPARSPANVYNAVIISIGSTLP